jgi:hygromycin-B 7''-O-kinase
LGGVVRNEQDDSAIVADRIRAEFSLGTCVRRFESGSVPVFAAGDDHVVKLFSPDQRAHFETELAALTCIDGSLSIPTPRVVADGERGGWWFIVMTRLRGILLADAWQSIATDERCRLLRDTGVALAELHATALREGGPLVIDWGQFIQMQIESCRQRQAAKGLGPPWIDLLDDFLARWSPSDDGCRGLLHTEVMREHLLVENRGGSWRLSGLVDFEPAMVGAPEYEFASVGIFVTCAEPGMFRVVLDAYGMQRDDELPMRIMAYALLHRYSNLRWYLERLPTAADLADLEVLARIWFAP